MPVKKRVSTGWTDPDDAPELTAEMLAEAEVFRDDHFVRRGPGRPKAAVTKEKISVRLDPDVLARLRESGPGWQSRINAVLRKALGMEGAAAGGWGTRGAAAALRNVRVVRRLSTGSVECCEADLSAALATPCGRRKHRGGVQRLRLDAWAVLTGN